MSEKKSNKIKKTDTSVISAKNKEFYILFLIVCFGFFVRLYFVLETDKCPFSMKLYSDSGIYHKIAMDILQNGILQKEAFFMSPAYAYFLALIYAIFGKAFLLIKVIQVIVSTLSMILIYKSARILFDKNSAIISVVIAALYESFIFYSGILLGESIQIFLIILFVYLIITMKEEQSYKKIITIGVILGVASLFRPSFFFLIIPLSIYLFFTYRDSINKTVKYYTVGCLLAGSLIPVIPATIHNYAASKDFVVISSNGGINLYIGNNEKSPGVFVSPKEFDFYDDMSGIHHAEKLSGRSLKPSEASSFWISKTFDFILSNPLASIKLFVKKVFIFIGGYENYQSSAMNPEFYKNEFSGILKFPFLNFWFVSIFGFAGIFYSWLRSKTNKFPIYLIVAFIIITSLFFVNGRFRLPLVPVLIIYAGYVVYQIFILIKLKDYKELMMILTLTCSMVLINFLLVPKIEYTDYDGYSSLGNYYFENGDYDLAIKNYTKSIELNKTDIGYIGLGNSQRALGNNLKAIESYSAALRINPASALTFFSIAALYTQLSQYEKALEYYGKSVEINKALADSYRNMAIIYYIKEDYEKSLEHFKNYLLYSNDEASKEIVKKDIENIIINKLPKHK